jgi:uncharacterized protein
MALEMRSRCEKCEALIGPQHRCFICPAECTFCPHCAEALSYACPRCKDELVRRPRAKASMPATDPANESFRPQRSG